MQAPPLPLLSGLLARWRQASWPWRALCAAGALLAALALAVALMAAWYYPQLPALDKVVDYQPAQSLQVFTRDGVELGQFGAERRQFVPIGRIPKLMQDAVLSVEDARFREHHGIDPIGVLRALAASVTPGGRLQGASTITQQVARTFFLSMRRTPERKLKEAMLALKIEQQLSKDQILELYMNQIFLGQRAYGFEAAAQVYFGKSMDRLTPAEAAMLAGLPQSPVYANPIANVERARQRQLVVLERMRATGVIDAAQHAAARQQKLVIRSAGKASLHAEYVAEMARQVVHERYGDKAYTQGLRVTTSVIAQDQQAAWAALRRGVLAYDRRQPYRGPEDHEALDEGGDEAQAATQALRDQHDDEQLRVALVTEADPKRVAARLATGEPITLDADSLRWAQRALARKAPPELALRRGAVIRVLQRSARGKTAWTLAQWPEVQSAIVSLDAATGRVRALVGGFDFRRAQFNHATQALRQPGSSFKPFLYSAALEHGVMPATLVNDAPFVEGEWEPQNADGSFDGPITLRQALARSKNMVSLRVLQQVGVPQALQWAGHFGFEAARQPQNLTLALGAGAATPLQMAAAYAVFANDGLRVNPVLVERITDAQGQVLYQAPPAEPVRAIPARNAFVMQSLLQEVTRSGTAARAQAALGRTDLYGKTGTTNDAVDAWFAGFQPQIVAVAWMGHDTPRSLGARESGGGLALPIWIDYMARALKGVAVQEPQPPQDLLRASLNGVDDWLYADLPADAIVPRIDVEEEPQPPDEPASAPALQAVAQPLPPPPRWTRNSSPN